MDFSIAKVIDTLRTMAGSRWYVAPEVQQNGKQTRGSTITFVKCLEELPSKAKKAVIWQH
jgi:hypothetical protein